MSEGPSNDDRADHRDRVVIVTGAGSGIGRATAELVVRQGGRVVAADVDAASLTWCQGNDRIVALAGDVSSDETNESLVAAAVENFGGLDAAVLNAGVAVSGSIVDLPMERFEAAMATNVGGVARGIRAAVPAMIDRGGGSIAVTASTSGHRGDPFMWAYNTSKAAVINLARSAALELGIHDIRVNAVCPGPTITGMTEGLQAHAPMFEELRRRTARQRWATADEVAAVFGFLIGPDSAVITGAAIDADGGISANTGQFLPPPLPAGD